MSTQPRIATYREFWPFYLSEHSNPVNRWFHFVGTTMALVLIAMSIVMADLWWLLGALLCGYGFAWLGHFLIEKNRPATFQYPIWSFVSDWRMWLLMLLRRPLDSAGPADTPD